MDLQILLSLHLACDSGEFLPVPDPLTAPFDLEAPAQRLKGIVARLIQRLFLACFGEGEQRAGHRMLVIRSDDVRMAVGAACIADIANIRLNVLEGAGVLQAQDHRSVCRRRRGALPNLFSTKRSRPTTTDLPQPPARRIDSTGPI